MVGENNKILTVSYGTFSCTLEGFDDPFSMMKAIAEYFRDLTAGDRFFGAEPPQPDTEALHKIAKQTANTAVDVEVSDNAMILRNANGDGGFETVGSTAPAAVGAVAAALTSGATDAAAATPLTTPAPTTPSDFGKGDTIAEKLQRIRAAVSRDVAKPEDVAAFFSEDQHADESASGGDTSGPAAEADAQLEATADAAYEDETLEADTSSDSSTDAEEADLVDAFDEIAEQDKAAEDTDADEAVKADAAEADDMDDAAEDASDEARSEDVAAAETADEVEAVSEDDAVSKDKAASEDDVDAESSSQDAKLDADADVSQDDTDADAEADADVADAEGEAKPRRRIMVQKISRADVEAAQPGGSANGALPEADAAELSPEAEAALMRELEAVEAEMETPDAASLTADAITPVETPSEEAEALAGATPKRAVITSKLRPGETEEQRQARLERRALMVEDEDAALNRLMDATSSRLSDDDEGAVRRASIAHLKAAVAATKADDSIAQAAAVEEERELDQYRSDLAKVVRPSKSKPRNDGDAVRSRPLMLVSEQRIEEPTDDAPAVAARDVRSRPITAGNLALQEQVEDELNTAAVSSTQAEDFEGFAARFGALELPDLLEAAAAHFTYVEGTTSFTRPMLMRKISSASSAQNISREAGLRSFGALLREGKLIKGDDGKFVISANSRFAP